MNKIVGGLLVAALLSKPSILTVEVLNYEVYKSQHSVIAFIKKQSVDNVKKVDLADVDGILNKIDGNRREIISLSKLKTDVCNEIQYSIGSKAAERILMTEEQIEAYKEFYDFCNGELSDLSNEYSAIDEGQILKEVQQEIIKEDLDIRYVYEQLNEIDDKQTSIIRGLSSIINMGRRTLAVL